MKTLTNKLKWAAVVLLAGTLVMGCSNNDSDSDGSDDPAVGTGTSGSGGSSSGNTSLAIQGSSAGISLLATEVPVIGAGGSEIGTLSLTDARVLLKEIKFHDNDDSSAGSDADDSSDWDGPYEVDLLTNTMNPNPSDAYVAPGTYEKIGFKIHKLDEDDAADLGISADDALMDRSIYMAGTYTPTGGSAVTFEMSYDVSEEFLISGVNGVEIGSDNNDFVIAFRFAEWFDFSNSEANSDNVDLSDLGSGDIALNEDVSDPADAVRDTIKKLMEESADYGKDEDGDGELGEDEDEDEGDE